MNPPHDKNSSAKGELCAAADPRIGSQIDVVFDYTNPLSSTVRTRVGRRVQVTGAVTDGAACLVGETLSPVWKMEVLADSRSVAKGTNLVCI